MFSIRKFWKKYILRQTILPPALYTGTKVQFGAGGYPIEGFNNHDAEVNICQTLPYADNSVEFIVAEHLVEHISTPSALKFFDECYRILKPEGRIRISIPVIIGNNPPLKRKHARDLVLKYDHLAAYSGDVLMRLLELARFNNIEKSERNSLDQHHKQIGKKRDTQETFRVEATK